MKMNCYIDGDHLCIVREDFENLQEDNAVFIPLNSDQINKINIIDPKICRKCGSVVIDYTTKENGLCDFCEGRCTYQALPEQLYSAIRITRSERVIKGGI